MTTASIPRFPSAPAVHLPREEALSLVLPSRLLAQISGHMARHADGRETGLQLFGAIVEASGHTLLVPLALIGGGLDALRRDDAFFADILQKELYLAGLRACYPAPRRTRWSELGNVHLHPDEYGIFPSQGDLVSAAEALQGIADPHPAWAVGIVHRSGGSARLAFFAVRGTPGQPRLAVLPWEIQTLPTLADPACAPSRAIVSPFRVRALIRALAAEGLRPAYRCDPDAGISIRTERGMHRLPPLAETEGGNP